MTKATGSAVKAFYDERVEDKIRDFTDRNPRIEAAVCTLAEWAPVNPKRILEIGCGIGAMSYRMARAWPEAEVIGYDISPVSIKVAKTCFKLPNLSYRQGLIEEDTLSGKFDFMVLMDVYEHIAIEDRPTLHAAIKSSLDEDARVFFSVPTPNCLQYAREHTPSELQPVDENVGPTDALNAATNTDTHLFYYREVGIWNYGDYAHFVLGRFQSLADVSLRTVPPDIELRNSIVKIIVRRIVKIIVRRKCERRAELLDYLGTDRLRPTIREIGKCLDVSRRERRQLANRWLSVNQTSD